MYYLLLSLLLLACEPKEPQGAFATRGGADAAPQSKVQPVQPASPLGLAFFAFRKNLETCGPVDEEAYRNAISATLPSMDL